MSGAEAASPPEGNIYQQILTQLSDSVTTNTTAAASSPAPKKEASEPPKTELVHSSTEVKHGSKAHEKKHAHGHAHHGHGHSPAVLLSGSDGSGGDGVGLGQRESWATGG